MTRKDVTFMKDTKLNLMNTQLAGQVMTLKEFVLQVKRIDFVNIYKLVEKQSFSKILAQDYDKRLITISTEPIDCEWTKYSKWTGCKNGERKRTRSVKTRALFGGKECAGKETEIEKCEGMMI